MPSITLGAFGSVVPCMGFIASQGQASQLLAAIQSCPLDVGYQTIQKIMVYIEVGKVGKKACGGVWFG